MAHLIRIEIMFEGCPVDVVIVGISVNESIEEQSIERNAPVIWGWTILVTSSPFAPVEVSTRSESSFAARVRIAYQ